MRSLFSRKEQEPPQHITEHDGELNDPKKTNNNLGDEDLKPDLSLAEMCLLFPTLIEDETSALPDALDATRSPELLAEQQLLLQQELERKKAFLAAQEEFIADCTRMMFAKIRGATAEILDLHAQLFYNPHLLLLLTNLWLSYRLMDEEHEQVALRVPTGKLVWRIHNKPPFISQEFGEETKMVSNMKSKPRPLPAIEYAPAKCFADFNLEHVRQKAEEQIKIQFRINLDREKVGLEPLMWNDFLEAIKENLIVYYIRIFTHHFEATQVIPNALTPSGLPGSNEEKNWNPVSVLRLGNDFQIMVFRQQNEGRVENPRGETHISFSNRLSDEIFYCASFSQLEAILMEQLTKQGVETILPLPQLKSSWTNEASTTVLREFREYVEKATGRK